MKYRENYEFRLFKIKEFLRFNANYIIQICQYIFSPYLLLVIPATAIICKIRKQPLSFENSKYWKMLCLLIFFVVSTITSLSVVSSAPFFRYLCPLIPIFIIFAASTAVLTARIHFSVPIIVAAILIISSPIKDFIYEITHDYDGPIEGIVKYINANGNKDDIVAITYGDMPLKFYTNMRIIGGLTGEDYTRVKEARWVIMRKYAICDRDLKVRDYFLESLSPEDYEAIVIDYPDTLFENREVLCWHNFRTVTDEDRVVIYRKIKSGDK